jgi:hypothetical protein
MLLIATFLDMAADTNATVHCTSLFIHPALGRPSANGRPPSNAPPSDGRVTGFATRHARSHGRIDALLALAAPGLGPVERLQSGLVLRIDWAPVFERRHLLAGLVDQGVIVGGFGARFGAEGGGIGGAGEDSADTLAEGHDGQWRSRATERTEWESRMRSQRG